MCSSASSKLSTIFTERMRSEYSVDPRKKCGGHLVIDQQRLDGVASRRILNLRIHREGYSLVQVRRAIDKHVTDSLAMAQDGDPAVLLDEGNKLFRASGNQQVYFPLEPQQLHHVRTRLEHRK